MFRQQQVIGTGTFFSKFNSFTYQKQNKSKLVQAFSFCFVVFFLIAYYLIRLLPSSEDLGHLESK